MLRVPEQSPTPAGVRVLLAVSPFSPLARALGVEYCGDAFRGRFVEWEKTAPKCPRLCKAFASRYFDDKRPGDAVKWGKDAVALSPDLKTYRLIAYAYWSQGKKEQFVLTLDEYLDHPDYGLEHAAVCTELARHFMGEKEWEKATTYAQSAADTYSAWGLLVAADCYEGQQRWKNSEKLRKAVAERYDRYAGSVLPWYFFCRRTGHGDLEAARQAVNGAVESWAPAERRSLDMATFYLLEKKPRQALSVFTRAPAPAGHPLLRGMHLALLHDELKDAKARDEALERAIAAADKGAPLAGGPSTAALLKLAKMMAADLAAGGKANIDLAAADRTIAALNATLAGKPLRSAELIGAGGYFLGKYLSLHGKSGEAVKVLERRGRRDRVVRIRAAVPWLPRRFAIAEITPESYQSLWEKP